jgi:hypothetical protein
MSAEAGGSGRMNQGATETMSEFEPVIGLEIHVQLKTRTKLFCGNDNEFGADPNEHVCPVCLGLPGALPVLNRQAVELGVRAALGLHCTVHQHSIFARNARYVTTLWRSCLNCSAKTRGASGSRWRLTTGFAVFAAR